MIDLLSLMAFHAAYAETIDSDRLEQWPDFFTSDTMYRVTHVENEQENLPAGIIWADSRAMLEDRVAALREANIYERQRYRHLLGIPVLQSANAETALATTAFIVARIMGTGETQLFATGVYRDRFVKIDGKLLLAERVVICDSTVTDTLMALPL
jgi:anthranilate 1,2-dioxygenase small subunit/terephthalate 1,2-dioxygenase oxygenase component beta subunit